jgi:hypothetical protein
MPDITALVVRDWGVGGLLTFCIILILVGKLTPRSVLDDVINDRNQWRDLAMKLTDQVDQLLTVARATEQTLRIIQTSSLTRPETNHASSTPSTESNT